MTLPIPPTSPSPRRGLRRLLLGSVGGCLLTAAPGPASHAAEAGATVPLAGAQSSALDQAPDLGAVMDDTAVDGARLQLTRPPERAAAFAQLLAAQVDPASPLFHHWLTAAEIGAQFGPTPGAIAAVTAWLRSQGLTVTGLSASRLSLSFTGSAGQVSAAFAAPVHAYVLRGSRVAAFGSAPRLPAGLAGLVDGIVGLDGVRPQPLVAPVGPVVRGADGAWHRSGPGPALTSGTNGSTVEDVGPADFATIYDVTPLRTGSAPILGAGQTIAVVEDTDVLTRDWTRFRGTFGLSSYPGTLSITHPGCADPGRNADEIEAALDMEWATAVAPAAAVTVASCSNATGGIEGALQGLVDQAAPPRVISVSYGECESALGASTAMAWASLLQQGQAEGISIFVSSGDSGAAGCDQGNSIAANGIAVNGLASSPYDIAVGGTDFNDAASNTVANYWTGTNTAAYGSAKSYIPEQPWNDTCADPILAHYEGSASTIAFCNTSTGQQFLQPGGAGGGSSVLFAKPAFQSGGIAGMPNDGARDLPDVALFAANGLWGHALLFCMSDPLEGGSACTYGSGTAITMNSAGGTSFAAPAMAGIQALIDQKKGAAQGNPAARLYALAAHQYSTTPTACQSSNGAATPSSCLFHDSAIGGIDQACRAGQANCVTAGNTYGVLSLSATSEVDAYPAGAGYDRANGLGSLDVARLVNAY